MYKCTLLLAVMLFTSRLAIADTFSPGVATRCSPDTGLFEITAVIYANEGDAGDVPLKNGFSLLEEGQQQLSCNLSTSITAKATIRVYGADNGMCMGAGQIIIDNLVIGKTSIIKDVNFNWHCPTDPILTDINVQYKSGKVILKQCMAETWEWGQGFTNVNCKSRVVR
ncbi:MAG TPA: hypothetical protein VES38_00265 [Methylotenera sp.]|nr:hypothetical protein [Methylotenera sp.]